jgi:predicted DNA-binding mobile mystery protein A
MLLLYSIFHTDKLSIDSEVFVKKARIRRRQIDRLIEQFRGVKRQAWVREVRDALGMTAEDLAGRMGVIRQRVNRLEKDEVSGKLSIESLARAAEALNCELVYVLVPKEGLERDVRNQALKLAKQIVGSVDQSMSLEDQRTSKRARMDAVESLASELVENEDRRIWRLVR